MKGLDCQQIGEGARSAYTADVAARYRQDDEVEVGTANHLHVGSVLSGITAAFGRPISVLEIGCGTGRYFHCLRNVERLVGMDVSPDMLTAARHPVRAERVTAKQIELVCANIYTTELPPRSFDFIYSVGVLGGPSPFTLDLCNKLHDLLTESGILFFDAIDRRTRPMTMRAWGRVRGSLRRLAYPLLPLAVQQVLDERRKGQGYFPMTPGELESIMRRSRFAAFSLWTRASESPLWTGKLIECTAWVDR